MTFAEAVRILTIVASALCLGWLVGMVRAYTRLAHEKYDPTYVPRAMLLVTLGQAIVVAGLLWRVVQFYTSPFTPAQIISLTGIIILDLGLIRMHRGLTAREDARRRTSLSEVGEHDGPATP